MLKLFIDTSSTVTTCGLIDGNKILIEESKLSDRSHSEELFIVLNNIFKKSNCSFKDLNEAIYVAGPGSFTGLRIAYSAVSALKLSLGLKTFGVSALKSLINNITGETKKLAIIESTSDYVFAYFLDEKGKVLLEEKLINIDDLIKIVSKESDLKAVGSGALKYKKLLKSLSISIKENKKDNYINVKGMLSVYNNKEFIHEINYLKNTYAKKGGRA
jgi:tRNA threonylcarbamoyladenosine biosynthesis protein TsaB